MEKRIPASMRSREALLALIEGRLASPTGRPKLVGLKQPFRSALLDQSQRPHRGARGPGGGDAGARPVGARHRRRVQVRDRPVAAPNDCGLRDRQAALEDYQAFKSRDLAPQGSGASRSWPPGASHSTAARCCCI